MFLRRYTRTKDGKTHTYYALVESVRSEAGPRQHVVAYLGELNHHQHQRGNVRAGYLQPPGELSAAPPLPRRRSGPGPR